MTGEDDFPSTDGGAEVQQDGSSKMSVQEMERKGKSLFKYEHCREQANALQVAVRNTWGRHGVTVSIW